MSYKKQELLTLRVHLRFFGGVRVAHLFSLCVFTFRYDFRITNNIRFVFTSSCLSYLLYLCLFTYNGCSTHIMLWFFVVVFFIKCTMPISSLWSTGIKCTMLITIKQCQHLPCFLIYNYNMFSAVYGYR